jgi:hypothetical protein
MKYISVFILLLVLVGCTTQKNVNNAPQSYSEFVSEIESIKETNYFTRNTVASYFEKIMNKNNQIIYKANSFTGRLPDKLKLEPGFYKIQFRCGYRDYYNFNWLAVDIIANEKYIAYCLTEKGEKSIFGAEQLMAFYPFISRLKDYENDHIANQKIIDNPPTDIIDSNAKDGKTRLIVYNKKTTVLGMNNAFTYKILLNGNLVAKVDPNKYLAIDLPNGEYEFELTYVDIFTFRKQIKIVLDGKTNYIYSYNGMSSINAEVSFDKPNDFAKTYKPHNPFRRVISLETEDLKLKELPPPVTKKKKSKKK